MYISSVFVLLLFDHHACTRPRSVNLALETVLEFNKDSDMTWVDTVQNFLSKIKSTVEEARANADTRRHANNYASYYADFLNLLRSYNELDLKSLLTAVQDELRTLGYCDGETENDDELRRYLRSKLLQVTDLPGNEFRRSLNEAMMKLMEVKFSNDEFGKRSHVFGEILNDIQLFRRRGTRMNLRSIVKKSIDAVKQKYYCSLDKRNRQKLVNTVKYLLGDGNTSKYGWNFNKQAILRNDYYDKYSHSSKQNKSRSEKDDRKTKKSLPRKNYGVSENQRLHHGGESQEIKVYSDNESDESSEEITSPVSNKHEIDISNEHSSVVFTKSYGFKQLEPDSHSEMKKRKRFEIKHRESVKDKKYILNKKNKIRNLKLLTKNGNVTDYVNQRKKKHLLKKLLSKDSSDTDYNSENKDDSPVWVKYATGAKNKLKTFVTLYPERIDIFHMSSKSPRIKSSQDTAKKRLKIKSTKDKIYNVKVTAKKEEFETDNDKSAYNNLSSKAATGRNKKYGRKVQLKNKHINRRNKLQFFTSSTDRTNAGHKESSSMKTYIDASLSSSVEYFGNLYNHIKNNKKTKQNVLRTFRKSNDKDELQMLTNVINDTDITNSTDNVVDKQTTKKYEDKKEYSDKGSQEVSTQTYGTLAFWSGTESSSVVTVPQTTTNTKNLTTQDEITKYNDTKILTGESFTTEILFRSHYKNHSQDSHKNMTYTAYKNNNKSHTTIESPSTFKYNMTEMVRNVTDIKLTIIKNNTSSVTKTTPLDLRRYLEDINIESVEDKAKKEKVQGKIREDIEKLLMTTTSMSNASKTMKDPIDELEMAFDL